MFISCLWAIVGRTCRALTHAYPMEAHRSDWNWRKNQRSFHFVPCWSGGLWRATWCGCILPTTFPLKMTKSKQESQWGSFKCFTSMRGLKVLLNWVYMVPLHTGKKWFESGAHTAICELCLGPPTLNMSRGEGEIQWWQTWMHITPIFLFWNNCCFCHIFNKSRVMNRITS